MDIKVPCNYYGKGGYCVNESIEFGMVKYQAGGMFYSGCKFHPLGPYAEIRSDFIPLTGEEYVCMKVLDE